MGEAKDWGEPWVTDGISPHVILESEGEATVCRVLGSKTTVAQDRKVAGRITACVSFLAGIPTERLTTSDPVALMLLAALRGADQEAATYADEVIARANAPEGFVERAELEAQLAEIKAVLPEVMAMEDDAGWAVVNKYAADVVKAEKPGPVFGTVPMTAAALAMTALAMAEVPGDA